MTQETAERAARQKIVFACAKNSNMETICCASHRTAGTSSYSQTGMASELDECPSAQVQSKAFARRVRRFQFAFRAGARCVMQGAPGLLDTCEDVAVSPCRLGLVAATVDGDQHLSDQIPCILASGGSSCGTALVNLFGDSASSGSANFLGKSVAGHRLIILRQAQVFSALGVILPSLLAAVGALPSEATVLAAALAAVAAPP